MSISDVSPVDLVAIMSGLASIYFGWQQNRIFKEQNKIFATQAGFEMPENVRSRKISTYWPTIAAITVAALVGFSLFRVEPLSVALPWSLVVLFAFVVTLLTLTLMRGTKTQHSAIAESERQRDRIVSLTEQLAQLRSESLSIAVNGKLVVGPAAFEEQRKLEAQSNILSPLQAEAFSLAQEIMKFIAEIGPRPQLRREDYGWSAATGWATSPSTEGIYKYDDDRLKVQGQWTLKLISTWESDFSARVNAVVLKFGKIGINAQGLQRMSHDINRFSTNNQIFEIGKGLMFLANGFDTMKAVPFLDESPK